MTATMIETRMGGAKARIARCDDVGQVRPGDPLDEWDWSCHHAMSGIMMTVFANAISMPIRIVRRRTIGSRLVAS